MLITKMKESTQVQVLWTRILQLSKKKMSEKTSATDGAIYLNGGIPQSCCCSIQDSELFHDRNKIQMKSRQHQGFVCVLKMGLWYISDRSCVYNPHTNCYVDGWSNASAKHEKEDIS